MTLISICFKFKERMVWTVLGDPESYYVYETCPEIPADRLPDVKSM